MSDNPAEHAVPPLMVGGCAALACIWEATAAKPGNVYRGADFEDLSYADFLTAAAVIAPFIDQVDGFGVGATILHATQATRELVGPKNVNLGILLLIAPLAAAEWSRPLAEVIGAVLKTLTDEDCQNVYAAIRLVQPGGLGSVETADVNADAPPNMSLVEAMSLAADRDLVARQYINNFADVFATADAIETHARTAPLFDAVVRAFLELLAREPDSLIARKCGEVMAREVSGAARSVLETLSSGDDVYRAVLADFDFWLRSDGNRLNPGTSADIIAAALFVLLRDRRLNWPLKFYAPQHD